MKLTKVSKQEEQEMVDYMASNLNKNPAQVGTFFYDVKNNKLFLVDAMSTKYAPTFGSGKGKRTTDKLNKDIWADEWMVGDFTMTPRGRVFYDNATNTYEIMVGHWVDQYPDLLNLVKNRFHLNNEKCELKYGEHWEIGKGFDEL
jgi:hypothetical protein